MPRLVDATEEPTIFIAIIWNEYVTPPYMLLVNEYYRFDKIVFVFNKVNAPPNPESHNI